MTYWLWWPALLIALFCVPSHADVHYQNCAQQWRLPAPAQRILVLNQHAADVLIALGVSRQVLGVAYIDDNLTGARQEHYLGIPVITEQYPSAEAVYALRPDLIVGGFASAFGRGLLSRPDLAASGMASYLLDGACAQRAERYFDGIERDLSILGQLVGQPDRAQALIAEQRRELAKAHELSKGHESLRVFYLDSLANGLDTQGGRGFISELMEAAGARNPFDQVALSRFVVSPELLLAEDPDVILLADAAWSPAAKKIAALRASPLLSRLSAVREQRFVTLPFSHLTPGVHSAAAARRLAAALYGPEPCCSPRADPLPAH